MIRTINQNEAFSTFDLGLAAALLTENFRLTKLDKSNPKKVLFCFEHQEGIEQAVENYFSGNFQVDAQIYFNQIKSVKNRLFSN